MLTLSPSTSSSVLPFKVIEMPPLQDARTKRVPIQLSFSSLMPLFAHPSRPTQTPHPVRPTSIEDAEWTVINVLAAEGTTFGGQRAIDVFRRAGQLMNFMDATGTPLPAAVQATISSSCRLSLGSIHWGLNLNHTDSQEQTRDGFEQLKTVNPELFTRLLRIYAGTPSLLDSLLSL